MLQIKDISKEYRTGSLVQKALDHVSLNLRDNEFVAILGPSGSGKTTLLNIIGGLDRYDSGDLIINGVSTRKYKDRDWDSYRNHTIGFVFQSYNLIPHQTVLANVELALTIGGISRAERKRRAQEALKQVGLGDQMHKKPAQMSGGQMQRVAIARALVNDPDILLADEPTGALDSETSVQVMDLLKAVAKDRLVVMVTHNPELAEQYATRIVRLKDGVIRSDTDPFDVEETDIPEHRNLGKASMSFLTALSLSFNNLRTKLARTVLVAFAGSIGIIGIALILSLSNGVNRYIHDVEEDTLSEYPLAIQSASFDLSSFFEPMGQVDEENSDKVQEMRVASSMFTNTSSNDLKSLKKYFDTDGKVVNTYAKAIEYTYNLSPQIYTNFNGKVRQVNPDQTFSAMGFSTSSSNSMMSFMTSTDLFYALPREKALYEEQYDIKAGRWPEKYNELVLVVSPLGKVNDLTLYAMGLKDSDELDAMIDAFSRNEDVGEDDSALQVFDYEDFIGITFKLINASDYYVYDANYNIYTDKSQDVTFMRNLVNNGEDLTIVGVVRQKEDANAAMLERGLHYPAELLDHVLENALNSELVQKQLASDDVNVITNKKFGEEDEGNDFDMTSLFTVDEDAMQKAFSFDTSALNMDFSSMDMSNLDFGSLLNPSDLQLSAPDLDFSSLLSSIKFNIAQEDMQELFSTLLNGYLEYSSQDPSTDYQKLPESLQKYLETDEAKGLLLKDVQEIWNASAVSSITQEDVTAVIAKAFSGFQEYAEQNNFDDASKLNEYIQAYLATEEFQNLANEAVNDLVQKIMTTTMTQEDVEKMANDLLESYTGFANENAYPDLTKLSDSFASYMDQETTKKVLMDGVTKAVDTSELESKVTEMIGSYSKTMTEQITKMITNAMTSFAQQISESIQSGMEKAFANIGNAFSFDANAFSSAIHVEMNEEELSELFASLMSKDRSSYESNLRRLGYADLENPSMITIYPVDFEGKTEIKNILSEYNERMQENGEEEKIINYTDIVGTMMSSVTDIINAISYVLVAFVAISLVVSSIMIGVITYISVLERKKEIGILRAIGASKRNISEVFNAETFIIGILAGLFGVVISLLLLIPGNYIIHSLTGHTDINAALPFAAGVALVTLSVILTLIGGIIPSRKAAKSDPVEALRTE